MKFKDAYCTTLNKLLTIEDVVYLYKNEKKHYKDLIEKNLLCPECKQPHLSYNNGSTPYFSVYPKAQHAEGCSLKQDEMSSKQTAEFINDSENEPLVLRQMESVLVMLMGNNSPSVKKTKKTTSQGNSNEENIKKNANSTSKRIPRKRIDSKFETEDFDCDKIFYGSVHLKWEKDKKIKDGKEQEYYKILLYGTKKYNYKKLVCKLKISPLVYYHLPPEYKNQTEYDCNIVFIAKFKNYFRTYQSTSIRKSQLITLEKIV